MTHFILVLIFSLFLNLLCFTDDNIANHFFNEISMVVLDAEASDNSVDDSSLQKTPSLVCSACALNLTVLIIKPAHQSLFLKDRPVRGPPEMTYLV